MKLGETTQIFTKRVDVKQTLLFLTLTPGKRWLVGRRCLTNELGVDQSLEQWVEFELQ